VLLGAALLLGLGAAVGIHRHARAEPAAQIEAAPGEWFDAVAGSRGPAGDAERTTCGLILTQRSLGVTEPVLPCGAKLLIGFGDRTFLTSVIDNRLKVAGRQFELTEALAQRLGIEGTQQIRWRFAQP